RAQEDRAGARSPARFRELGAHARALWPLLRGRRRGLDEIDRPAAAADARRAMTGGASATAVDGRRQRSERTRKLIIEAYLELLRENPDVPTSARIAERAGYSVR